MFSILVQSIEVKKNIYHIPYLLSGVNMVIYIVGEGGGVLGILGII